MFKFFIILALIILIFTLDKKFTLAVNSISENNILTNCSNPNNCVLESWKVNDINKSFNELIDILENTPRIKIISAQNDYLHALAISRVMKFVDDIEIKKYEKDNILKVKSSSRTGFYDLGVNKRRINTLHFRLIEIYE